MGSLLYVARLIVGDIVNLLIDTSASNCFAPKHLVSALQLPMMDRDASVAAILLNGVKLHCKHTCAAIIWFGPNSLCKIYFLIVDMKLPIKLCCGNCIL